jgi:hypothetical protein
MRVEGGRFQKFFLLYRVDKRKLVEFVIFHTNYAVQERKENILM